MKLFYSLFLVLIGSIGYAQVCTIDYSLNDPGFYPSEFEDGEAGVPYETEVTIVFDTQIGGVDVASYQIKSIVLPFGLTWACSVEENDCVYHPQDEAYACVSIYGTPVEAFEGEIIYNIEAQLVNGDIQQIQEAFEVVIAPSVGVTPRFTFTPAYSCETSAQVNLAIPNPIAVFPSLTTTGVTYEWDFGNGYSSTQKNPPVQTYNGIGDYTIKLKETVDTTGFKLKNITVFSVGCDDPAGWGNPDIYIQVLNGAGNVIYSTESSPNDGNLPLSFNMDILVDLPPLRLRVMDDDEDNWWGKTADNCIDGEENLAYTTMAMPNVNSFGTTTQIKQNGDLNFSYTVVKEVNVNTTTATFSIHPKPAAPVLDMGAGTPVILSTEDLGHVYQWSLNNDYIYDKKGASIQPSLQGTYKVTAINEFGCHSTSNSKLFETADLYNYDIVEFTMFPNPASTTVNISFKEFMNDARIVVYDLTGRVAVEQSVNGENLAKIDVSNLSSGVYTVAVIQQNGKTTTEKLVVR